MARERERKRKWKLCPIQFGQTSHILLQSSEALSKISSVPWVQISRSYARYCAGKSKNCPEARGGSVRVQISLSRPVSFFMVKPRFCPNQDHSSPVQSSRPWGFGEVLSDQPAASRLEHWVISVSSASYPAGSRKPLIRWIGKTPTNGVMYYG
ncbi:hypothetical protein YC2023_108507 [Brassica napus]